jgi:three-Cys-motif partner protein
MGRVPISAQFRRMKSPQAYRGNEQTYVKHFFLERYLERVAYIILSNWPQFVYVDGFSGPWKSRDEEFKDTSFVIAIDKLREVKAALRQAGKAASPRCIFIEKNPESFAELQSAVSRIDDLDIATLQGEFRSLIPAIAGEIGRQFSFVFIDPTGWTGFDMHDLDPLLKLRGEVLINFMFDHINRFVEHPNPKTAEGFNSLFGHQNWYDLYADHIDKGLSREDAIIAVYIDQLRQVGGFAHVTCTRIKKPLSECSYFYLIYATRHWKGILEFRKVEQRVADEQESVFGATRRLRKVAKTGQEDLFARADVSEPNLPFEQQRSLKQSLARRLLFSIIRRNHEIAYESVLGKVLEIPLVSVQDLNGWLADLRKAGAIEILGLEGRERVPKPGHIVRRLRAQDDLGE